MNNWKPVRYSYVLNKEISDEVYETGWTSIGFLAPSSLAALRDLYSETHLFNHQLGGMFYSLYSQDLAYRKKVHYQIGEILKPILDKTFFEYKVVINSFIVKVSGPESEFCFHQDHTSLDETKYSTLTLWIPLQDTTIDNGCMCAVPKSHRMFSPLRGISFPLPFNNIIETVKKYLVPIELKAGEILLFDNRVIHNSFANHSGVDRVVAISGIFPVGAEMITCYKNIEIPDSQIELIKMDEDYLLTNPHFFHGVTNRPETGRSIGFVTDEYPQINPDEFIQLCKAYGVEETNNTLAMQLKNSFEPIDEPVSK